MYTQGGGIECLYAWSNVKNWVLEEPDVMLIVTANNYQLKHLIFHFCHQLMELDELTIVEEAAMHFTFAKFNATTTCFLLLLNQNIAHDPKLKQNIGVLFLAVASLDQFELTKPCNINSPSPSHGKC